MRSVGVLCVIFVSFAAATGVRAQGEVGVFDTQDGGVFGVHVEEIVSWLNRKEDVRLSQALRHWDNNVTGGDIGAESVAVLRLLLNRDVRVVGLAQPLQHPSITRSSLATFISVETDGDGSEDGLEDGTGDAASGFPDDEKGADRGVGSGNFVYVGGGATSAGATDANPWATPQRMSELSNARGGNSPSRTTYSLGTLLGSGAIIRHVPRDGAVVITVRVQGRNGEDFGSDSDDTEAPDLAAATPYMATVQLTALP